MSIADNLRVVRERIARAAERAGRRPEGVTLVAVTKTVPPERIREAFDAGQRHFGENRLQEAQAKMPLLADLRPQITWHMVGHLQTNKVRACLEAFDIIESVDSLHLGQAIEARARAPAPVLLEVNVAGETTKFGFRPEEVAVACETLRRCSNLQVRGLMTVAPMAADPNEARPVFRRLRELAQALGLRELSMGMTADFEAAVEEGATIVRIGTAIFGARPSWA